MHDIKVTIVTPSYNQGQYIEETILSVLNQTYFNIEYIVVDACSTDGTNDILDKYAHQITKVIREKDNGQSDAINKGFKLATGTLVGWLNSDDVFESDCVERIVKEYIQDPDCSVYYNSNYNVIDSGGALLRSPSVKIPDFDYLLHTTFEVLQPGSFYQTNTVKEVGYLKENIQYCMDLDLWLSMLRKGGIKDIKGSPTALYREWELTKTMTGAEKFYKEIYQTLRRHGANMTDKSIRKVLKLYLKNIIKSKLQKAFK